MAVALFGGTFNPIHNGHLRIASELAELLSIPKIRLMPCASPSHRQVPQVSAKQRVEILKAAISEGYPKLDIETIELQRAGPSYSIDSVVSIRQTMDSKAPLFLCLGMDSFASLDKWHRWNELTDYCHIIVCGRPNYIKPQEGSLINWINQHNCDCLSTVKDTPSGCIYFCDLSMLSISSTRIRNSIKQKANIDNMTPPAVIDYIRQNHLYE